MWNSGEKTNDSAPTTSIDEQRDPKAAPIDSSNYSSAGKALRQAVIGRSITVKGEISGAESLHIEGCVQGSINLADNYVHVGPDAIVSSNITARELVIRGTLQGNTTLDDRLDIRSGGSLTGDVTAKRISIADGAYFKGSIDMRRTEAKVSLAPPAPPELKNDVVPVLSKTEAGSTGS